MNRTTKTVTTHWRTDENRMLLTRESERASGQEFSVHPARCSAEDLGKLGQAINEALEERKGKGVNPAQVEVKWRIAVPVEWIPVTERLPTEDGCKYLVASPGTVFVATREGPHWVDVAAYYQGYDSLSRYVLGGITHWAELPALPPEIAEGA